MLVEKPRLMVIDSMALLFRGFYSLAMHDNYMENSKGLYTNGLYQFTRYMMDAVHRFRPTHLVCTFDMGSQTFRREMYPEYKGNRSAPPAELIPQFDELWDLVKAFDIPCIGKHGFEADDLIGSIASRYSNQDVEIDILTGDGDTLQLINERTRVLLMQRGFGNYDMIDRQNLFEKKNVLHPYHVIELKGLMGDSADNIPGCPHVGPKTASKLITEYDTIDNLYTQIDLIQGKLKERLVEHKDLVYLSKDLATIRTDVPLEFEFGDCRLAWNREKVIGKLEELEFNSIVQSIA